MGALGFGGVGEEAVLAVAMGSTTCMHAYACGAAASCRAHLTFMLQCSLCRAVVVPLTLLPLVTGAPLAALQDPS